LQEKKIVKANNSAVARVTVIVDPRSLIRSHKDDLGGKEGNFSSESMGWSNRRTCVDRNNSRSTPRGYLASVNMAHCGFRCIFFDPSVLVPVWCIISANSILVQCPE
jgi:hypothetical protein